MPPSRLPPTLNSPPKVRLTVRVGVVGHRPHRLKQEAISSLSRRLSEALSAVKKSVENFSRECPDLFSDEPICLRAISPLAEGTDRYFAKEALKLGYELCCPLPFYKEEFENDFRSPNSLLPDIDSVADFNNILHEAGSQSGLTIFELDGARDHASEAYAAAGRVVLNQSDLLIVVWDGDPEAKRGGTYETLIEAIKFAVPVLWIDAWAPHNWQLLQLESDLPSRSGNRYVPQQNAGLAIRIDEIFQHVLRPPKPAVEERAGHGGQGHDLRTAYFAEKKHSRNRFFWWKLFRDLVASPSTVRWPSLQVQDFEEAVASDWPQDAPNEVERWVNNQLRPHYAWSDKLADYYADKYRSSFVLAYLLGAFAVILALFAHMSRGVELLSVVLAMTEFGIIFWILLLVYFGNKYHWHQRWMDYRLIAELVRQLRFLIPLGGARPFPRLPQHLSFGNPINSWMYWHLRAIDRVVGLPNGRVTPTYLEHSLTYVANVVSGQIKFHDSAANRSARIEEKLHRWGLYLFIAAFGLLLFHIGESAPDLLVHKRPAATVEIEKTAKKYDWDLWLIVGAGLPAIGAALAAINNQGEFARIAKRSRAMAGRLRQDLDRLLQYSATARSGQVAEDALRIAQTMVDEVLDWRLVFLDRPLVTPA